MTDEKRKLIGTAPCVDLRKFSVENLNNEQILEKRVNIL